jgi:predicted RNA-binding protein YlqC (UPF0109 family)
VGDPKPMTKRDPYQELEEMILYNCQMLADFPDDVTVSPARGEGFVHFEVRCHESDVGSLVGKRGANAESMRTLTAAAATMRKIRLSFQVVSRDGAAR